MGRERNLSEVFSNNHSTSLGNVNLYRYHENYLKLGLDPLPIPPINGKPTKKPVIPDWPTKAVEHLFKPEDYAEPNSNIGSCLGGAKNRSDVDIDDHAALKIAAEILRDNFPATTIFGRPSKPKSHYFFECDESLPSVKILDPTLPKRGGDHH